MRAYRQFSTKKDFGKSESTKRVYTDQPGEVVSAGDRNVLWHGGGKHATILFAEKVGTPKAAACKIRIEETLLEFGQFNKQISK
ncbi:hypothetical protein GCM10010969_08210 [Saccharibacillus kuerlensis]|uniref:Uncharacterized protein n=1 Tax=Saccharibacillus kuerlensis TaxID=459527 RepID=A0ABQ2KVT9_9BACL|nr:hypothetical protein GCM10010969_08210 [Saccharibacillus kuerlensis]